MISKLSAKYQLCAIHTADTIDGKVHRIRESPSNPRKSIIYTRPRIGYSVLTGGVVNRVRGIYVLPAGVVRCQSSLTFVTFVDLLLFSSFSDIPGASRIRT